MSTALSDVQLSEVSATAPVPALSATQVSTCMSTIEAAIKGKTLQEVLTALPGVLESTYVLVSSFIGADSASISSVVLTLVESGLGMSGLPAADLAVLTQLLSTTVPAVIALVAKYLPEVEEEVESCCTSCWSWVKAKF